MRSSTFCILSAVVAVLAPPSVASCEFDDVTFTAAFEGGRLSGCRRLASNEFELGVTPEDAPINPSAWYAFRVEAATPRTLDLTLVYAHGRHRYQPKVQKRGGGWSPVPVEKDETGKRARFTLATEGEAVTISAQPLLTSAAYEEWYKHPSIENAQLSKKVIGISSDGRAIEALQTKRKRRSLVLLGRQHPPETTGATAFMAFTERLLEDDALARRFRSQVGILAIPMLNPDGVARGQWRHNARGVDLNRDWGPFTQPETRAARDAIQSFAGEEPGRLALFLDFHSTWRDVLYTQPDHEDGGFSAAWRTAIAAELGDAPERDPSHNPDAPTAKSWVHETYRAPAITFEVGDETPDEQIRLLARAAAETAMKILIGEQSGGGGEVK